MGIVGLESYPSGRETLEKFTNAGMIELEIKFGIDLNWWNSQSQEIEINPKLKLMKERENKQTNKPKPGGATYLKWEGRQLLGEI